jgi:hypothetical protein
LIVETAFAAAALSWVFDKVLENTVEDLGRDACKALAGTVWHELATAPEPSTNDNSARAARGAHLAAMEDVIGSYHEANAARWERNETPELQAFTSAAIAFCREQRRLLNDENVAIAFTPTEPLKATIEGLPADSPRFSASGERAAALGNFAEEAVLEELARALSPISVPDDFAVYLRTGGGQNSLLFLSLFGGSIAEQLKSPADTRFRDILTVKWLADLKAQGFETGEALARIETQFGRLRKDAAETRQIIREVVDTVKGEQRLSSNERVALAAQLSQAKTELDGTRRHPTLPRRSPAARAALEPRRRLGEDAGLPRRRNGDTRLC